MDSSTLLWQPSQQRISNSNLTRFIKLAAAENPQVSDYDSLYKWSVENPEQFWSDVWKFSDIVCSKKWDTALTNADAMPGAVWFAGARLNYAENLLRYRDDRPAIVSEAEGRRGSTLTYNQLYSEVARCAAMLKQQGVGKGDRVAGYISNGAEAIIALLATSSIGAIWSCCSPDFGVKGVLERFAQIQPKVLFTIDGYKYNGTAHDNLQNVRAVVAQIPSIEKTWVASFLSEQPDLTSLSNAEGFYDFQGPVPTLTFEQLPFDHPLYILYSSGTTGKPKCIVHGAGGSLIQHLKEHQLHTDITRDDVLFYFTTCGWMMWNWLVSGLASGCCIVVYDGSPFHPRKNAMWAMIEKLGVTVFGTSARFISTCAKSKLVPRDNFNFARLKTILSTGSPLAAEGFDYVYQKIKSDIMLSSISGGTDIVSCFVLGCPIRPVHRGEIQARGLGLAVDVFEDGKPVRGKRGELVCTKPFPCMPLGFWNEPDHGKYLESYFSRFENIWAHGDYAEITANDGMIIYGRSDAVLNPGGVRIGTAEIYRQVEKVDEVLESLCIAQQWEDDVRIVLFVMLREGVELTAELQAEIRKTVRENTTPRHVPKKIIAVADLPRTMNGKIAELAVRNVVHGDAVNNRQALANPQALEYFYNLEELA